jgi:hypothetical protein
MQFVRCVTADTSTSAAFGMGYAQVVASVVATSMPPSSAALQAAACLSWSPCCLYS